MVGKLPCCRNTIAQLEDSPTHPECYNGEIMLVFFHLKKLIHLWTALFPQAHFFQFPLLPIRQGSYSSIKFFKRFFTCFSHILSVFVLANVKEDLWEMNGLLGTRNMLDVLVEADGARNMWSCSKIMLVLLLHNKQQQISHMWIKPHEVILKLYCQTLLHFWKCAMTCTDVRDGMESWSSNTLWLDHTADL